MMKLAVALNINLNSINYMTYPMYPCHVSSSTLPQMLLHIEAETVMMLVFF